MSMMKKICNLFLLVSLLFAFKTTKAQYKPKAVDAFVNKLQRSGIDTILIYMSGCGECAVVETKANCSCKSDVINSVYILYRKKNKFYKTDFSCCTEDVVTNIDTCLSIPYFFSLKDTLNKEKLFYNDLIRLKKFAPPIPTDDPFDEAELIFRKQKLHISISSYQKNEGYKIWKQYFWINKEIKLFDLIKKDLSQNK